jgi:hypothetical protein
MARWLAEEAGLLGLVPTQRLDPTDERREHGAHGARSARTSAFPGRRKER